MTDRMPPRIGVFTKWPEGRETLASVEAAGKSQGVSVRLLEIVRLHCSVINSCGFCIAMHSEFCREQGVTEEAIDALKRRSPIGRFGDAELSALALAEEMTCLGDPKAMSFAVNDAKKHFGGQELSVICYQIAVINAWNRLAIADGLEMEHFETSKSS